MKKLTKTLITTLALSAPLLIGGCAPKGKYSQEEMKECSPETQEASYTKFGFFNHTKTFVSYTLDSYEHSFVVKNIGDEVAVFYKPIFGLKDSSSKHEGSILNSGIHNSEASFFALGPGESRKMSFIVEGDYDMEEMYLATQTLPKHTKANFNFSQGDVYDRKETFFRDDFHLGYTFNVALKTDYIKDNNNDCYYCVVKYAISTESPFSVVYKVPSPNISLDMYYREGDINQRDIVVKNVTYYEDPYAQYQTITSSREYANRQSLSVVGIILLSMVMISSLLLPIPVITTTVAIAKRRKKINK